MGIMVAIMVTLAWCGYGLGFMLVRRASVWTKKLEVLLWNGRIDRLARPPYSWLMTAMFEKKWYAATALLVMALNLPMLVFNFLLGMTGLSVVFSPVQGFVMGALVAMGDALTRRYGTATAVFELTGFSLSAGLGAMVSVRWITTNMTLADSWEQMLTSGLLLLPFLFLIGNGLVEAAGIQLGATGVPGIDAVREKRYRQD